MNTKRKDQIDRIADRISDLKEELEGILSDEQEYHDNVPENLQTSERYEASETAISELEDSVSNLETTYDSLKGIVEG